MSDVEVGDKGKGTLNDAYWNPRASNHLHFSKYLWLMKVEQKSWLGIQGADRHKPTKSSQYILTAITAPSVSAGMSSKMRVNILQSVSIMIEQMGER